MQLMGTSRRKRVPGGTSEALGQRFDLWHGGLGIQRSHSCSAGHNCGLGFFFSLLFLFIYFFKFFYYSNEFITSVVV